MKKSAIQTLNSLSNALNDLYRYVNINGDNFGEPAINSGPCGSFAKVFFECFNKFNIEDVEKYDLKLLDIRSYGLSRDYPRYCPEFSIDVITSLINKHLKEIDYNDI